jgi:hypothetical protein
MLLLRDANMADTQPDVLRPERSGKRYSSEAITLLSLIAVHCQESTAIAHGH